MSTGQNCHNDLISIVIPVRNGAATLAACLRAAVAQQDHNFELIVVNDGSHDDSPRIAGAYPCTLVSLDPGRGAAAARNAGARAARGRWLFFTDADCVPPPDTLRRLRRYLAAGDLEHAAIGGSYTPAAHDPGFYNAFQSAFVHYHETRRLERPDYLATHALLISRAVFLAHGGFAEDALPILEDVEFSHRLSRRGLTLRMAPDLLVGHIFGFDLAGSWRNALRKTRFWVRYSLGRRDLLADSGTASRGLKLNVACFGLYPLLLAGAINWPILLWLLPLPLALGLWLNRGLLAAFYRAGGGRFATLGALYFGLLYPLPVSLGTALGLGDYLRRAGGRS